MPRISCCAGAQAVLLSTLLRLVPAVDSSVDAERGSASGKGVMGRILSFITTFLRVQITNKNRFLLVGIILPLGDIGQGQATFGSVSRAVLGHRPSYFPRTCARTQRRIHLLASTVAAQVGGRKLSFPCQIPRKGRFSRLPGPVSGILPWIWPSRQVSLEAQERGASGDAR